MIKACAWVLVATWIKLGENDPQLRALVAPYIHASLVQ